MRSRLAPYTPWLLYAAMRLGEGLVAAMFWGAVPTWKLLSWWALVAVSGGLADWYTDSIMAHKRGEGDPPAPTWPYWLNAACFGSAAYFLFVPGSLGYQGLLNVALLCTAALFALQSVSGAPRAVAAVVLMPTSLRYLLEGGLIPTLLGMGGCLISFALVMVADQSKRLIEEQRRLRERAERAAEAVAAVNLAKARFFAAVSHDLRQPVHAIGLYAEFLQGLRADPQQTQALHGIRQAWQSLDTLLAEVLDLTKLDTNAIQPQFETVEVGALLRSLVQQHGPAAERKGIRLVLLGEVERHVWADALMLQRAISNVLANAIKFSPIGARVALAVRPARQQGHAAWRIQVRDHGPGIDASQQQRIFEEFIQTHNAARQSEQGFGLGLAIAKRFCELIQGEIRVRSAPGRGTCMEIVLPASAPPQQTRSSTAMAPWPQKLEALGAGQAVLLVEDDPMVVEGMLLLHRWGYTVQHAATAQAALALPPLEPPAHIALCDVRLPGAMSGLELARQLRLQGLQVLLMSGETDPALREQARHAGLLLLVKPVAPQALHAALAALRPS